MSNKLDALLRVFYSESTTQGEKDNALSLFKKRCIKEGIDPDSYMHRFKHAVDSDFNFEDFFGFDDIFSQFTRNYHTAYQQRSKPKIDPNINPEDHSKYLKKDHLYFSIKDIIASVQVLNGQDVIFLSTLCRAKNSTRWGLKNFIIYPNCDSSKLVEKYFKQTMEKNSKFIQIKSTVIMTTWLYRNYGKFIMMGLSQRLYFRERGRLYD